MKQILHLKFSEKRCIKIYQSSILILSCILFISFYAAAQTTETFDVNGIPKVYVNLLEPGPVTKDSSLQAHVQLINASGSTYTSSELYDGFTTIKGHGNSTWNDPKKSYNLSLKDAGWEDFDAGLLGMPADNSWILIANYKDRTLMRNALAYFLGNAIGMEWSPRYRFVEFYLDSSYLGLYFLVEKVSRSTNRVNIKKLSNDSLSQTYPNITGGYIIEVDNPDRLTPEDSFFVTAKSKKTFVVDYPQSENITTKEVSYIHKYTDSFETALFGSNFKDTAKGYAHYADVNTFVDWYIVEELAKNRGSYLAPSCFFYKDRLGKLKAGPIWDFDQSWGNGDLESGLYREDGFYTQPGKYYQRLFQDTAFVGKVQRRWSQVRHIFDSIPALIANTSSQLVQTGAIDRNFAKWPVLGVSIPQRQGPFPKKYSGEITHFSDWAKQHTKWLNIYLQTTAQAQCDSIKATKPVISIIGTDQYDSIRPFEARTLIGFSTYYWNNVPTTSYDTIISTPGKYWLRMSVNGCTTLVSDTLYFATDTLTIPVAASATHLRSNSFTANWSSVPNADGYKLDVSTSPFATPISGSVTEGFNNGLTPPSGWIFSNNLAIDTKVYGAASPSLRFNKTGKSITTATYPGPATRLSFWIKGISTSGTLLVEGFDGSTWKTIENITSISTSKITKVYNSSTSPALQNGFVRFRFTYTKTGGSIDLDDITVNYTSGAPPSFVDGYNGLLVTGTSLKVTGLSANTNYYYRTRAVRSVKNDTSKNSNIIQVTTCTNSSVSISNIAITNVNCIGSNNSGAIDVTASGSGVTYSWSGPNGFTSSSEDINNLFEGSYTLTVTTAGGCEIDTTVVVTGSSPVSVSDIAITNVSCNGNNTGAIDVTATGSGLVYSWNGPNNFTSPNEDITNLFGGSYALVITSGGGCELDTTVVVTEPAALTATTNANPVTCSTGTTTLVISASGGTGSYHYTISDGTTTTGPQDNNNFTVTPGNYTITVADDNGCVYNTSITINDGPSCHFTAGNLVVLQTTGTVSKASSPVILKEFTTNGTAGITDSLPATGATPIQTSGVFGGSEGFLTTSTDNNYVILGGYGTSGSFTDITGTASSAVPRVIGRVASSGIYQQVGSSSTAYSNNDIRGAISDGTNYWASGASVANVDGIDYYGPGTFAGLGTAATPPKAYGLRIFNGQIYYSTEKSGPNNSSSQLGIFALGTGLPTTNPVTITQVINTTTSTLEDFSFNSDISVCYIANNVASAAGGIQKWTKSGGVWTLAYTLGTGVANTGTYGLVVDYSGANPVIYATTNEATGNRVITITDAGAGSSATTIVAAQTGVFYKGICFAPVGSGLFAQTGRKTGANSSLKTSNTGLDIHVFPNPSANQFTLTVQSNSKEKVEIIAADVYGKKVYQAIGSGNSKYSFGKEFISGIYFVRVMQGKNIKTLKLIKGK